MTPHFQQSSSPSSVAIFQHHQRMEFTFHNTYVILKLVPSFYVDVFFPLSLPTLLIRSRNCLTFASTWVHLRFYGGVRVVHLVSFLCYPIMYLRSGFHVVISCIKTMFGSSLPPVVCGRIHVLFGLFVCLRISYCAFVLFFFIYVASFSGLTIFHYQWLRGRSVISLVTCDRSVVSRRVMGRSVISVVTCDTSVVFRRVRGRSVVSQWLRGRSIIYHWLKVRSVDSQGLKGCSVVSHWLGGWLVVSHWLGGWSVVSHWLEGWSVVSHWFRGRAMVSQWLGGWSVVSQWHGGWSVVSQWLGGCQ